MFEILFARYPIKGVGNIFELMQALKKFDRVNIPNNPKLTSECKNLIDNLLTRDPSKRISWKDFFNHPWFKIKFTKKKTKEESKKSMTKSMTKSMMTKSSSIPLETTPLSSEKTFFGKYEEDSLFTFEEDLGNKSSSTNDTQKFETSIPIGFDSQNEKEEAEMSYHLNSTSPFVKSYNPIKFNIIDDYSSTDVLPTDPKFKHYSAPIKHPSMSTLKNMRTSDRKAYSMMNVRKEDDFRSGIRGKKIREDEDNKNNLSKTMKDYAYASYSLLKDSFKSL